MRPHTACHRLLVNLILASGQARISDKSTRVLGAMEPGTGQHALTGGRARSCVTRVPGGPCFFCGHLRARKPPVSSIPTARGEKVESAQVQLGQAFGRVSVGSTVGAVSASSEGGRAKLGQTHGKLARSCRQLGPKSRRSLGNDLTLGRRQPERRPASYRGVPHATRPRATFLERSGRDRRTRRRFHAVAQVIPGVGRLVVTDVLPGHAQSIDRVVHQRREAVLGWT
jgi:hypothetical protein